MSISLQALQAQDEAFLKQAQSEREQPKSEAPKGLAVFMQTLSGPVSIGQIHQAIQVADVTPYPTGRLNRRYMSVRDAVMTFSSEYEPGRGDDAIARLCIPLLGYARMASHLHAVASTADRPDLKPDEPTRFADVHALGEHTQSALVEALKLAHHELVHAYMNFIAGTVSESVLDAEIGKETKPVQAAILRDAAAILKDGLRATHSALSSGATSTDDLTPAPIALQPRSSEHGHGVHVYGVPKQSGTPEQTEEGE